MSPTPPSTACSSTGARSPEGQFKVIRKRNRVPLSCAPCRQRKLKCNRATPCENCIKRGDAASCTYAQPGTRKKNSLIQGSLTSPDDMQNRIDRLESLVLSLMTNGSQSAGIAAAAAAISGDDGTGSGQNSQEPDQDEEAVDVQEESDTEQVTKSFGVMKVDSKSAYYISDAHWASIIHDIAEVRNYFVTHKRQYEEQAEKFKASRRAVPGGVFCFGVAEPPSRAEIMSSFPLRFTTDMLISRFFNFSDHTACIIHVPTFRREYNEYWSDPSKTSIVWIGMLFAMMRLAMLSYYRDGDEPPEFRGRSLDMAGTYRNLMTQCLTLGDYTKPHKYMIEALVYHLQGDFIQTKEADVSVWLLTGTITRLAMRMGYHRDSKVFPNISAFHGEMRRRVWTTLREADVLFSFQVGLPSMLRTSDFDTEVPRNLYDDDIDEDCEELPSSRPPEEPTPVSGLIAKSRLVYIFARVIEHTSSIQSGSYDTVNEIDADLRRARDLIPEHLQFRPIEKCLVDSMSLISSRLDILSVYHKAQCVLHRRYLNRARDNPRFTNSRRTCIDSSMELLQFQSMIYKEIGLNNRTRRDQVNSLSINDFLLSATIVCLDLYYGLHLRAAGRPSGDLYTWGRERWEEMLAAIQRSWEIWHELRDESMEAYKAADILGVMLRKLTFAPQGTDNNIGGPLFEPQDEKQSAAMTLGLLSSGMSPLNSGPSALADPPFKQAESQLPLGGFGTMGESGGLSQFGMFGPIPDMQPLNLDWDAWDNYLQNSTFDTSSQLWPMLDMQQQSHASSSLTQATISTSRNNGADPIRLGNRLPAIFPQESSVSFDSNGGPGLFLNLNSNRSTSSNQPIDSGRDQAGT